MDLGIRGKKALITGGATGIGRATAFELVREGVNVAITSRKYDKAKKVVDELNGILPGNYAIGRNITEEGAPQDIINELIDKFGEIDIVINNAGSTLDILDPYCSIEDWRRINRLVLEVAIEINNLVIPKMKKQQWGRIVNITSLAGLENSGPVTYSATKAALTAYSRSMARVLATENSGIVMSAFIPGVVLTEEGHWQHILKTNPAHAEKYLRERTVLNRFGTPEEISPFIAMLCSKQSSFAVGTIMPIDGGQSRQYFQATESF